jgi:hypothetical protein
MQITCGVLASRLSKMPPDAEVRILLNEDGEERELAITETALASSRVYVIRVARVRTRVRKVNQTGLCF